MGEATSMDPKSRGSNYLEILESRFRRNDGNGMDRSFTPERLEELRKGISASLDRILDLQREMAGKLDRWAEECRERREKFEKIHSEKDQKKKEEMLMAYLWRGELPGDDKPPAETPPS